MDTHSHSHSQIPTRLTRSRSGAPISMSQSEENNHKTKSQRYTDRSKSTTRSRKESTSSDEVVKINNKKVKSVISKSPSAWALSPGRTSPWFMESPVNVVSDKKVKSSGGGVGGVLKYFRQKKVNSVHEVEFHRLKMLHCRLMQYRFVNAKAQASMASLNHFAQRRLFNVWLKVSRLRNMIVEKRIHVLKLKHEIKLSQIVNPQMRLLNEWSKLEPKNCESVGRVTRKLSAILVKIPSDDNTKADVVSVYKAMSTAVQVMRGIEKTIFQLLPQIEKILYMVTELLSTLQQENEYLKELYPVLREIPLLLEKENYLRIHIIQSAGKEGRQR